MSDARVIEFIAITYVPHGTRSVRLLLARMHMLPTTLARLLGLETTPDHLGESWACSR